MQHLFLTLLKFFLLPFAILYGIIVLVRSLFYRIGVLRSAKFNLPLIAVGNLSVGGTGKTPHIEYLIRQLSSKYHLATMSRGYGRKTKGFFLADIHSDALEIGDEPLQLWRKFPNVAVSVAEKRLVGIPQLLAQKPQTQVILLDDAFQHRAVSPKLNILLTEYESPFYKDYLLPVGWLREFRNGYKRADMIIITKCPKDLSLAQMQNEIMSIRPLAHQDVYFTTISYGNPYSLFDQSILTPFRNEQLILVTGIASNKQMITYLESMGNKVSVVSFPDHYFYKIEDIVKIEEKVRKHSSNNQLIVVTTEKDATRLNPFVAILQSWKIIIAVLPIEVTFLDKEEEFLKKVDKKLKK